MRVTMRKISFCLVAIGCAAMTSHAVMNGNDFVVAPDGSSAKATPVLRGFLLSMAWPESLAREFSRSSNAQRVNFLKVHPDLPGVNLQSSSAEEAHREEVRRMTEERIRLEEVERVRKAKAAEEASKEADRCREAARKAAEARVAAEEARRAVDEGCRRSQEFLGTTVKGLVANYSGVVLAIDPMHGAIIGHIQNHCSVDPFSFGLQVPNRGECVGVVPSDTVVRKSLKVGDVVVFQGLPEKFPTSGDPGFFEIEGYVVSENGAKNSRWLSTIRNPTAPLQTGSSS